MHQGVVRDMEQQRIKRERQADFDMQKALEEEYKQDQTVHDSTTIQQAQGLRLTREAQHPWYGEKNHARQRPSPQRGGSYLGAISSRQDDAPRFS
jgi:PET assembly of cytochrome c oxidase, mitochondrial